jgi:hypothetical protein
MVTLPSGIKRRPNDSWAHLNCNGVDFFINIITSKDYKHQVIEAMHGSPMDEYDVDGDHFWTFIFEETPEHHYNVMPTFVAADETSFAGQFYEELANYTEE